MITLLSPSRRSVLCVVACATAAPVRWVYLGVSVRTMEAVARWLGPKWQRVSIAEALQETSELLRQRYIDYIGRLGSERESDAWWFGSLSEKNPGVSQAFLRICYVAVAKSLCRQHGNAGSLLLVVESPEVRSAVAAHLRESDVQFNEAGEPRISRMVGETCDWSEMLARRAWGIGRQIYRMIAARALGFSSEVFNGTTAVGAQSLVLLHNWVDARSFDVDGRYRDIFFGPLREKLQKRGLPVVVVAAVTYKAPYLRLLIRLRRAGIAVLVPQAALTIGTVLRWGWSLLAMPPPRRVWPRFEGFDVSDILNADERMDWKHTRAGDVFLISDVVRQWRRHLDVRAFIYTYEGHTWERGYCRAFRRQFPQARLVGYHHSALLPMLLSRFLSRSEWGKVPFPDRVVTNGPHDYGLLRENGIPEQALARGSAFRYSAMGRDHSALVARESDRSAVRILVAFSIFATPAAELLLAVTEAFSASRAFQVLLKFHPFLPDSRVVAEAGVTVGSLPVTEKPLAQLLPDADVLVYTDTTAAVEALACGVPVVHLLSSQALDMDVLGQFGDIRISVRTAEGLREAVRAVVMVTPAEREARTRRWREVVDLLLPPPDEKTIDLFMPEGLRVEQGDAGKGVGVAR